MIDIVLINIKATINNNDVICDSKNISIVKYYAVSYRWGEVYEWRVKTPFYLAHITSFSKENLLKLCNLYKDEIDYLWIDTIGINQKDEIQRKKMILNMDNIYIQANKIIGVPDLGYCSLNPRMETILKEEIIKAIDNLSNYEKKEYLSTYIRSLRKGQLMVPLSPSETLIRDLCIEWCERSWVFSERYIGNKQKKLETVILRGNKIISNNWKNIVPIVMWNNINDQHDILKYIINTKSTKLSDRLIAILPYTKYKHIKKEIIEKKKFFNSMVDLKMFLFNILDDEGKILLLQDQLSGERYYLRRFLPSFIKDDIFVDVRMFKEIINIICSIEIDINKNCIYIFGPYRKVNQLNYHHVKDLLNNINDHSDNIMCIEIVLCKVKKTTKNCPYILLRCFGINDKWITDRIVYTLKIDDFHISQKFNIF